MKQVLFLVVLFALVASGSLAGTQIDLVDGSETLVKESNLSTVVDQGENQGRHDAPDDGGEDSHFGVRFVCPKGTISDQSAQTIQYDHFCPLYKQTKRPI